MNDLNVDKNAFDFYDKNYSPLFLYVQRATKGGFEVVDIIHDRIVSNPLFKIFFSSFGLNPRSQRIRKKHCVNKKRAELFVKYDSWYSISFQR